MHRGQTLSKNRRLCNDRAHSSRCQTSKKNWREPSRSSITSTCSARLSMRSAVFRKWWNARKFQNKKLTLIGSICSRRKLSRRIWRKSRVETDGIPLTSFDSLQFTRARAEIKRTNERTRENRATVTRQPTANCVTLPDKNWNFIISTCSSAEGRVFFGQDRAKQTESIVHTILSMGVRTVWNFQKIGSFEVLGNKIQKVLAFKTTYSGV